MVDTFLEKEEKKDFFDMLQDSTKGKKVSVLLQFKSVIKSLLPII